ncbi:MAG: arsenate reductase ArsC [Candidatus Hydrogenedentes bacterium]|nr:arsenate reductase ArsC [Candidatus Hydrogenedentota bacterium]
MSEKPTVLFLCTCNSARSQMAEGLLRHLAGERFEVCSAGLEPKPVHPLAVAAMKALGIDISKQESKDAKTYLGRKTIHHAIFVCAEAEKNCPRIYPFALQVHSWPLPDPAAVKGCEESRLRAFCQVRDQMEGRITQWLNELETFK